jgi:hypothetical protein
MIFIKTQVLGINAYTKPSKFFISATIFSWTMLWYLRYLPTKKLNKAFGWMVILLFGFENIYIVLQASRGTLSHFNTESSFTIIMFMLMGIAISILVAWTAFIGCQFFYFKLKELPKAYLWGIRIGIVTFVIFSFQAFEMANQLQHTVGANDGGEGIPFLNWSKHYGDLRIAHFIGIHALQVFPFVGYYILKKTWLLMLFMAVYITSCFLVYYNALAGNSIF